MAKRAIEYAKTIKAEAIQVFASNPRGWAMPETNSDADQAFIEKASELDIETYIHAPFLINLGSPTEGTYKNSLASTKYSLKRGREIKARGVVIHTGSADQDPWLLLEPTAGQGQSLVKRLEDLNNYFEALEWHPKVGVCLDTCHVFAAGHDIKSKGGMKATIDLLVEVAGSERIQLIHANDSMDVLGSLKDRHQNLGDGEIGTKPFAELLAHPAIVDAPLILETPGEEPEHGREVAMLMKMRDK